MAFKGEKLLELFLADSMDSKIIEIRFCTCEEYFAKGLLEHLITNAGFE